MKKVLVMLLALGLFVPALQACTNLLVSKGASSDGSTFITYLADSHVLYGELAFFPRGTHKEGTLVDVYDWDSGKYLGQVKQVARTWQVVGNMNECQVSLGETTYSGRGELVDPKGIVDYGSLMYFALQRAKTAREAIKVMGDLVAEYGYASSGESFSIADPNEVWIMDLIGKGPGNKGAVWVALRVPDGYICGHANQARIRQFPLNDKINCMYATDVISFAKEKGYYKGADADFSFADAYAPLTFDAVRFCEARVWSMFRRAAPAQNWNEDYVQGVKGAQRLPLWVKPDKKLSVQDAMALMRDHYEGTSLDMTKDVGAGPYALPYRWRPLTWKVDSTTYFNERAISTQQTGFSFVAQARNWLPDPIGGVFWFGVDDTYSTVYVPMYCGIDKAPYNFAVGTGSFTQFTWDSAFWVFNYVANFCYLRYSEMIKDVQIVQRDLEDRFVANQPEIDAAALAQWKSSPQQARDYLTQYSVAQTERTVQRWRKLGEDLLVKYMDGNTKDELKNVQHIGYPESWYRRIANDTGDRLKMRKLEGETATH
jgi:dipeptidase